MELQMEDNMNSVKRVYVEKKQEFAVQAKELKQELKSYLGIQTVENVRVQILQCSVCSSSKKTRCR